MDGGGNHIVAGLAAVDVIVGMRFGDVANYFIGVHVGGSAASGLKNVHHELMVVFAGGDFFGCLFDGSGHVRRQLADPAVDPGSHAFDES